jgi:hypothetical protein
MHCANYLQSKDNLNYLKSMSRINNQVPVINNRVNEFANYKKSANRCPIIYNQVPDYSQLTK